MDSLEQYLIRKDIPRDVREAIQKEFDKRKEVEETLRRHVQMIDFANDTIMIRDLRDQITYWNQGAERLYGWSKEEALGKYVHTFLKTIFPKSKNEAISICLRRGYWEGELVHHKRDGTKITVGSRWTLQRDHQGRPVAFLEINNDITQLKKTEDALRKAHNQLEKRVEERTIELKRINQELKRVVEERKRLGKEILEISGMEQRRIGQDLHDGLSQHLTGIAFMGKVLAQKLKKWSLSEASHAAKIVELVNDAISQTRGLARGLCPVELDSNDFMVQLRDLANHVKKVFNIVCDFDSDQPILIHNHIIATHLYRIAQEAVNNAVRHGKPKKISIRLIAVKSGILMEIKDDGRGIPEKIRRGQGMGLRIMNYRAELINASLNIQKGKREGTVVSCLIRSIRSKSLKGFKKD
ncbi:MAG: PAS domain-containing sensor histidine kinase [Chlamydiae bacterium]|nr:PAS domain-containing sensor histidine kinase [Chlamydiota bacterium]MBI3276593.1 PAS domain-containing sensor histidine kinase [Chlamydiota bacterium]